MNPLKILCFFLKSRISNTKYNNGVARRGAAAALRVKEVCIKIKFKF